MGTATASMPATVAVTSPLPSSRLLSSSVPGSLTLPIGNSQQSTPRQLSHPSLVRQVSHPSAIRSPSPYTSPRPQSRTKLIGPFPRTTYAYLEVPANDPAPPFQTVWRPSV